MEELDEELLRDLLSYYQGKRADLVPILLEVQNNFGYLPDWSIDYVAAFLGLPVGEVYSVATFYAMFRLTPLGRNRVTVCRGTACHIRGSAGIINRLEKLIGVKEGETTADLEYTLETVACIGCCALAPCLSINGRVHGEMTLDKANGLIPSSEGRQNG